MSVRDAAASLIEEYRRRSRAASLFHLRDELDLTEVHGAPRIEFEPVGRDTYDAARAAVIAARLEAAVDQWVTETESRYQAAQRAKARVNVIAVTEVSDAFTEERDLSLVLSGRRAGESRLWSPVVVFKVWNAAMDRRTCDTCAGMDGAIVPWWSSFRERPGGVHGNCRCGETMIPMPAWYLQEVDPEDIDPDGDWDYLN